MPSKITRRANLGDPVALIGTVWLLLAPLSCGTGDPEVLGPPTAASGTLSTAAAYIQGERDPLTVCAAEAAYTATAIDTLCPNCTYGFKIDSMEVEDSSSFLCEGWEPWMRLDPEGRDVFLGYAINGVTTRYAYAGEIEGVHEQFVYYGWTDDEDPGEIDWHEPFSNYWTRFDWDSDVDGDHLEWMLTTTHWDEYSSASLTYRCTEPDAGTDLTSMPTGAAVTEVSESSSSSGDLWQVTLAAGQTVELALKADRRLDDFIVEVIDPEHCLVTSVSVVSTCPDGSECVQRAVVSPIAGEHLIQVRNFAYRDLDYSLTAAIAGAPATPVLVGDDAWVEVDGLWYAERRVGGTMNLER